MEKSYKQFVASVTRWWINIKSDEFFLARLKLTFFYSLTALSILAGASFILYRALLVNLRELLEENFTNPTIVDQIFHKTQELLQARILIIDGVIFLLVVFLGFFLTQKTLKPIKMNSKRQKQFIADASHELRTPIAVVISGLEVALRNKNFDVTLAKKVLENSLEEMLDLSKLSNSLLDIAKFQNNPERKLEKMSVKDLVAYVVAKIEILAKNKNILINSDLKSASVVFGSKVELSRVFYNILDNAITHTQSGGAIVVSDGEIDGQYVVSIADNGSGIPKEKLARVFDPFFQGDSSHNKSGAGLGLTLAKKIVSEHNGSIDIESEVGRGTTVKISLPVI
jgi:signal transduction histidine kinase